MVALRDTSGHLRGMLPQALLEIEKGDCNRHGPVGFRGTPPSTVSLWISRMRVQRGHAETRATAI
jgi:hypothetical protein